MKKTIKIFLLTIFSLILLSLFPKVEANSINSISMDIAIDDNGNASVTEIWKCKTSQGTEVYHPYYNLGNSEISNLTVSENGIKYTTLSTWNTSGTLSDKAYKCGINRLSNGVELCWGISTYGSHTYTIKYNISNFVSELSDSQMIYWTLIPYNFSNSIGNVYIKIHSNFNIPDSVGVWGYGNYGGTAYVYDGYIEMQSDGNLATDEYMTILVQFPLESFNCSNRLDYNFNHYLNMAEDGAEHYVDNSSYSSSNDSSFFDIVLGLFSFIISFLPFAIIIILIAVKSNTESLDFGKYGKKIPTDLDYYRDKWFPYTMPISDIYGLKAAMDNIAADKDLIKRHARIANATRKAIEAFGLKLHLESGFSDTVTVFDVPEGMTADDILERMREKHGIMLAGSFGELAGKVIRIGHMGASANVGDMLEVMSGLEETLRYLGWKSENSLLGVFHTEL